MSDVVGVAVAVHHSNNRNTQPTGLLNRNMLLVRINNKKHTGQGSHLLNTAQGGLELGDLPLLGDLLLLGQDVKASLFPIPLKLVQPID